MAERILIHTDIGNYTDYLHDESRLTGQAQSIAFPENAAEVSEIAAACYQKGIPITIQGARSGITGGAVPAGGHILNLNRMTAISNIRYRAEEDCYLVTVQPGVVLSTLLPALQSQADDAAHIKNYFFPPDPTETSATIGGMAATNASGARSYYYGAVRKHITALKVLVPGYGFLQLTRGMQKAVGNTFRLLTDTGREIRGTLPAIAMPAVKSAAGYFIRESMDLLDLFIGCEGTLGIITELEIKLVRTPAQIWGLTAFFSAEQDALSFVQTLRRASPVTAHLVAIEYFNHDALELLAHEKAINPAFADIPALTPIDKVAVYTEYHAQTDQQISAVFDYVLPLLTQCGGSDNRTWVATNPQEMKPLIRFRHAVPEIVNLQIADIKKRHPSLTKLGTDMAVPDAYLSQVMTMYNQGLQDAHLRSVIFGHIGNNQLHVNIIPAEPHEYATGLDLYKKWAGQVVAMGGSLSAEHGIGKIKHEFLRLMFGKSGVDAMQQLKLQFDNANLLNRGNLFDF